jgi:glycerol dehydrogenase
VDAIYLLAGLCGSVRQAGEVYGIAHAVYNAFSVLPELRDKLHGEKVAFGLVAQGILEKACEAETRHRIDVFTGLKIPLTLDALGLTEDVDAKLAKAAGIVKRAVPTYKGLDSPYTEDALVAAFKTASRLSERAEGSVANGGL